MIFLNKMKVSARFTANGKLLLWGEYLVLRGALALAWPLSKRQYLSVKPSNDKIIHWQSFEQGNLWMEAAFDLKLNILSSSDLKLAITAQKLLQLIQQQKPDFFQEACHLQFDLDFNRKYGFGSSATLISLLSQWSDVDPYFLLEHSFGGSGYDIATATANQAIIYNKQEKIKRSLNIPESISRHLVFVYLGQKQVSSGEIARFKEQQVSPGQIEQMNYMVETAASCTDIEQWEQLMAESEDLMSGILKVPKVKDLYFADYPFAIKSLGAWGGDFIMATCRDIEAARTYFYQQEKKPVYSFQDLTI